MAVNMAAVHALLDYERAAITPRGNNDRLALHFALRTLYRLSGVDKSKAVRLAEPESQSTWNAHA